MKGKLSAQLTPKVGQFSPLPTDQYINDVYLLSIIDSNISRYKLGLIGGSVLVLDTLDKFCTDSILMVIGIASPLIRQYFLREQKIIEGSHAANFVMKTAFSQYDNQDLC